MQYETTAAVQGQLEAQGPCSKLHHTGEKRESCPEVRMPTTTQTACLASLLCTSDLTCSTLDCSHCFRRAQPNQWDLCSIANVFQNTCARVCHACSVPVHFGSKRAGALCVLNRPKNMFLGHLWAYKRRKLFWGVTGRVNAWGNARRTKKKKKEKDFSHISHRGSQLTSKCFALSSLKDK